MKVYKLLGAIGAIALVAGMPVAAQQRHSTEWRTKPAKERFRAADSTEARRQFVTYSRCVVNRRYDRARALVLAPYASSEQSKLANTIVDNDEDGCLRGGGFDEVRMRFRSDVLAGGVAQALVAKDYPNLPAVIGAFQLVPEEENARLTQMNAAEIFGRCVVQRDPASVLALISSWPATSDETRAIGALRDDLGPCLAAGSTIRINEMFLRNVTAVAAYRLAQQVQPRGGAG